MNIDQISLDMEGEESKRNIFSLSNSDLGEIVWQHKCGSSIDQISARLNVKKWQVKNYIKERKL